jgi:hypothetical protein
MCPFNHVQVDDDLKIDVPIKAFCVLIVLWRVIFLRQSLVLIFLPYVREFMCLSGTYCNQLLVPRHKLNLWRPAYCCVPCGIWWLMLRTICQADGAYCCVPCVRQMVLIAVYHVSGRWCLLLCTMCQADSAYCCVPCVRQLVLIAVYHVSGR